MAVCGVQKWYGSTLTCKVYELMGVDTEKEMDIVTRKVDRVFQVVMVINHDDYEAAGFC